MKLLYLIIIFFSFGISAMAQHQIGVNIGYGSSFYKIKNGDMNKNKTIKYTPNSAAEIEINYKKRWPGVVNFGASLSYQKHSISVNETYVGEKSLFVKEVDYKTNNLYLKAFPEFIYGNKIKFYMQIGPALSILMSSSADGYLDISSQETIPPTIIHSIIDGDAYETFNKFSFGFFGGLGVDFSVSDNITISLSSQFDYSINSWFKKDNDTYSSRALIFRIGANYIIKGIKD